MNECPKIISRLYCASLSLALLTFGPLACTSVPKSESPQLVSEPSLNPADQAFAKLSQTFIEEYLALAPVMASSLGDHRRDAEWGDFSQAGEARRQAFYQKYHEILKATDKQQLSSDYQVDAAVLTNEVEARLFEMESLAPFRYSAMAYVGVLSLGLDTLISHEYGTPAARAAALTKRLQGVETIVAAARERLENPTRLDTQTAILQTDGLLELCQSGIKPLVEGVPDQARALNQAASSARTALQDFKTFLEKEVLPRSNRDFRLGKELYARKMQYDLADSIRPEALAKAARDALDRTLADMYQVALQLSPEMLGKPARVSKDPREQRKLVRAVLDRMALEQPTDDTLFQDAEGAIETATAFIRQKEILTIPDETCKVIKMPAFNAGFAGAYSQSSGPFDENFENFVAIEPPSATERDSFYREYNKSMLIELMLHEAVPGHCLQAMHAVKTKHPLRAIFGNGPYAEGWAMYSEEVMARHGFGGPRIRIVQLKLLARAIANTLLDYGVHTQNMSEDEAMRLLMEETYQERAEAAGKWRRVQLSSVQLTTYFYGYQQFAAMRAVAEKQPGFQEKAFHDQLLGSGAPPLKLLRARYGI
ncbi:DUF885 domain-containing protein [Oligoflexus tunisiensis]|uniref:DUF885 domain-containing protein n=1 Tax=Oligoflexus tunisiensis TaxID=708132 RepID=UPI00114CEA06|nr:DUF885 domain-containing protein [Oligoflexus tunisiensis]